MANLCRHCGKAQAGKYKWCPDNDVCQEHKKAWTNTIRRKSQIEIRKQAARKRPRPQPKKKNECINKGCNNDRGENRYWCKSCHSRVQDTGDTIHAGGLPLSQRTILTEWDKGLPWRR